MKRFPIDTIKVDRSFVRDLPDNQEDRAITDAVITMGKSLKMTIVAEGVETQGQVEAIVVAEVLARRSQKTRSLNGTR